MKSSQKSDAVVLVADTRDALQKIEQIVGEGTIVAARINLGSEYITSEKRNTGHVTTDCPARNTSGFELTELEDVLSDDYIDQAYISCQPSNRQIFAEILRSCRKASIDTYVHSDESEFFLTTPVTDQKERVILRPLTSGQELVKRVLDVSIAIPLLIAGLPFLGLIAIMVYVTSPGPVFYTQRRTNRFGSTYTIWKFRTMEHRAEADTGPVISSGADQRVTQIGRILRRTQFDETPQLIQIILGQMSFVGPRAERPAIESGLITELPEWPQRWFVKPGSTGLAQIRGFTGENPDKRLEADIEFARRYSTRLYVWIFVTQLYQYFSFGN